MKKVFLDAGYLVALEVSDDQHHREAREHWRAFAKQLPELVTTSFVLALGFFVLTLSSWQSVASFGLLSGIAILGALVADIVVLPALVFFLAHAGQTDRVAA